MKKSITFNSRSVRLVSFFSQWPYWTSRSCNYRPYYPSIRPTYTPLSWVRVDRFEAFPSMHWAEDDVHAQKKTHIGTYRQLRVLSSVDSRSEAVCRVTRGIQLLITFY